MNGNRVVADTNILIYLLNGKKDAADVLFDKEVFISVISEIELLGFKNLSNNEISNIKRFISDCFVVEINAIIKDQAIEYKRSYNLKTPDAIICATAKYLDIPLITSDNKLKSVKDTNIILFN